VTLQPLRCRCVRIKAVNEAIITKKLTIKTTYILKQNAKFTLGFRGVHPQILIQRIHLTFGVGRWTFNRLFMPYGQKYLLSYLGSMNIHALRANTYMLAKGFRVSSVNCGLSLAHTAPMLTMCILQSPL
jgi:hypothetical protein